LLQLYDFGAKNSTQDVVLVGEVVAGVDHSALVFFGLTSVTRNGATIDEKLWM
jgi:hypothetical protein